MRFSSKSGQTLVYTCFRELFLKNLFFILGRLRRVSSFHLLQQETCLLLQQEKGSLEAFLDPLCVARALIYRACAQNQASGNSPDAGDSPDEMGAGGAIQTSTSTRRGPGRRELTSKLLQMTEAHTVS